MSKTFALLDLPSQALAIQRLLRGQSDEEKLAWLGARGKLAHVPTALARPVYAFESVVGLQCCFLIDGDEFVFFADHTTYRVSD